MRNSPQSGWILGGHSDVLEPWTGIGSNSEANIMLGQTWTVFLPASMSWKEPQEKGTERRILDGEF